MSLREITLGILVLFLLICPFSHPENLICKTLESVTVLGLMLSLGVQNVDAIQETVDLGFEGQTKKPSQ
jgi:hypothetical protein